MHAGCLLALWTGSSATAVSLAVVLYLARAFGLTAFYHRYFAHRAFKTTRWFQFVGAVLGCLALQKGPLWWAAHHRVHHCRSDRPGDVHSPRVHGFIWAHLGWFLTPANNELRTETIRDFAKFPELRWLDRHAVLIALPLAALLYALGEALASFTPALQTDGWMLVAWGFFISTVFLYHVTYAVNSFAHRFGRRRFATPDDSCNNFLVALLALGEGWHNNHHYYPSSARQGFYWWELDLTYCALVAFEGLGLVWDLRPVPLSVLDVDNEPKHAQAGGSESNEPLPRGPRERLSAPARGGS
ncbi:MAG TPA: acyl-CoA desaturase [Pirellulales bacterium]|nr:acyl-CoA desaturase [Pirellulales bacterium]